MTQKKNPSRRIKILREDVARKIAAGEVIDRPFSVVREILDNAIDAESSELALYLENGGISEIRLVDNGLGMSEEDLKLCFLPHATSKIRDDNDLYRTTTLGFRGEALSSIANCAKLDIGSCQAGSPHGYTLSVRAGKLLSLEKSRGKPGTIVKVSELFYNMPARKKFLKRVPGETTACKTVFLDKVLANPALSFRFFSGGKLDLFLPPASPRERVAAAFRQAGLRQDLLIEEEAVFDDFSILVVGGRTELNRRDRKYIQIFVNGRRITEYAFIQAVQYGYAEHMPGKDFPVAFVFINVKPELVDFNIHPAKKECRFLNLQSIHKALVALIKGYLNKFSINLGQPGQSGYTIQQNLKDFVSAGVRENKPVVEEYIRDFTPREKPVYRTGARGFPLPSAPLAETTSPDREAEENLPQLKYLGQVFHLFLAVEYKDSFFLIDQHAAHEKILYNKLCNTPPVMQELIFPLTFETEDEEEKLLDMILKDLDAWGITLQKSGPHLYEITALSTSLQEFPGEELIAFLKNRRGSVRELQKELYSMVACRGAIKDGDPVDPLTARKLLEEVFALENARCPHGRPIWHRLTREDLFKITGRK